MTSALVTSVTSFLPRRGKATRLRPEIQFLAYFRLRQPGLNCVQTCLAAALNMGTPARRFSASGSPPARAS